MHLKWFFLLLPFVSLGADASSDACRKEIEQIDLQVQKLEQQKKKHQDLARQYQKQGDDWQYTTGNIQDGYAAWGKANQERKKAIDIQHEIDLLHEKKNRIIQFYPELWQP